MTADYSPIICRLVKGCKRVRENWPGGTEVPLTGDCGVGARNNLSALTLGGGQRHDRSVNRLT